MPEINRLEQSKQTRQQPNPNPNTTTIASSATRGLVHSSLVLAMVPVLDPVAGNIGLHGNGLTPSKIDDFLSELSL
jgi:hypothetical protein